MGDFEDRLRSALVAGSEDVVGAVGLADGARRRTRSRRRRRLSVGAALAVVAVVVPLGIVGVVAGRDDATDRSVVGVTDDGWQTVSFDYEPFRNDLEPGTLLVDVPPDWVAYPENAECPGFFEWGAPGRDDPCDESETVGFAVDSGNLDYVFGPGLHPASDYRGGAGSSAWLGHVELAAADVSVSTDDRQLALRILGSAREEGDEVSDLAAPWTDVVAEGGLTYPLPDLPTGAVEVDVRDDVTGDARYADGREVADGRWLYATTPEDGPTVRVTAPTLALAQVVAGSARPDTWQRVALLDGLAVDVPVGWGPVPAASCEREGVTLAPAGTGCDDGGPQVHAVTDVDIDIATKLGEIGADGGYVSIGAAYVFVSGTDPDTARRILASAGPAGEEPPDVASWRTLDLDAGVTAEVPADPRVSVSVANGVPRCAALRRPARREGASWVASLCRNRIVTVNAPTQALAQVVAGQVRGW
ncbi:hypothetical protein [Nocardioides sp.]|uniref:hypothetical protein n=1 Tax=Nocardioides sp. TaxID=35761 RepID=UPI002718026B|nr:hypothetical protein [Nocardioides sp.]MDO9454750.1 hypothetical protein [Nocardioides sp.]